MKSLNVIAGFCLLSVAGLVASEAQNSKETAKSSGVQGSGVVDSDLQGSRVVDSGATNSVDEETRKRIKEKQWMQDQFIEANNTTYAKDHRSLKMIEGDPGYTYKQFSLFLDDFCDSARSRFLPDSDIFLSFKEKKDELSKVLKQNGSNLEEFSRANFNKFVCLIPYRPLNEGMSYHYAHVWHVIRDSLGDGNLMAAKNELEDYEIIMSLEDFLKWNSRSVDPYYVTKKSIDYVSKNGGYVAAN